MTKAEKVEVLVRKAVENGWETLWGPVGVTYSDQRVSWTLDDYWPYQEVLFNHDFARALFGEEKREWLGGFVWYSLYEQDGEKFKDTKEVIDSWLYSGGSPKPTISELDNLPTEGIEICAGMLEKNIETTNDGWRYHLQQAVISDDPIGYMHEIVFGDKDGQ